MAQSSLKACDALTHLFIILIPISERNHSRYDKKS